MEGLDKNIKQIELKNPEEKKIEIYRNYLNSIAQAEVISSDLFLNKGKAHASILMATLLANTEHEVKMYCRGLSPGILCGKAEKDGVGFEGSYWDEFKHFFEETLKSENFGPASVKILIQERTWLNNQPFKVVGKALKNEETNNKILIREINPESKKEIEKNLGNEGQNDFNFAIFDNKAFRLEYSPNDYQAIGSFNNPSWCSMLSSLFDFAFDNATDLTDLVPQG